MRSGVGRDTTFVWGSPGTGKTLTIGALGAVLHGEGRSVLLVSHTNAAVDQALLRLADQVESRRARAGEADPSRRSSGIASVSETRWVCPTPTGGRLSVRRVLRPVGVGAESVPGV